MELRAGMDGVDGNESNSVNFTLAVNCPTCHGSISPAAIINNNNNN
jgi:hypothetical protein